MLFISRTSCARTLFLIVSLTSICIISATRLLMLVHCVHIIVSCGKSHLVPAPKLDLTCCNFFEINRNLKEQGAISAFGCLHHTDISILPTVCLCVRCALQFQTNQNSNDLNLKCQLKCPKKQLLTNGLCLLFLALQNSIQHFRRGRSSLASS